MIIYKSMYRIHKLIVVFFVFLMVIEVRAQVIINEIMQSNVTCIMDDLNDFPDSWLELYNTTSNDVNLKGYAIGESNDYNRAYKIQDGIIPACGYKLLYLDKVGEGMHADFRLNSDVGGAWLFDNNGACIDSISYPKMASFDVSYGRLMGDAMEWGFQLNPSPEECNTSAESAEMITSLPVFDMSGGLYDSSFDLKISMPMGEDISEDGCLAISTDGSWPKVSVGREIVLSIDSTTIVRARIISSSKIDGPVVTNSYIFHPEATELAVISIVTDNDYLYSPTIGILEAWDGHTVYGSNNWRRPINIEYFDGLKHENTINQIAETKVKGNWSRQLPQKSMAFYANKRFGVKKFDTTGIWDDKPNVTKVKSFELRNSGQRFTSDHLCDQFAQRLGGRGSSHLDWAAYRPVICYLNGNYHGIYDMRERCNDDNIEANYDGLEDIDMVTDWIELETGDPSAIDDLQRDFGAEDISIESLAEVMDVDGFVEMFILQWVLGNTDFPRHNIVSWRYQTGDRRWHWLLKDLDCIGVDGNDGDYIDFVFNKMQSFTTSAFPESGKAFKVFLESEEGCEILIPRLMVAMGDYLREDRAITLMDEMAQEIAPEYARHLERFYPQSDTYTYEYWLNQVESRKNEIEGRTDAIISQLRFYFGYEETFSVTMNTDGFSVGMAGQELRHNDFSGKWFYNQSLEIECPSAVCWQITEEFKTGEKEVRNIESSKFELRVENKDVMHVDIAFFADPSAIAWMDNDGDGISRIYNLAGRLVTSGASEKECIKGIARGIYVMKEGGQVKKMVIK